VQRFSIILRLIGLTAQLAVENVTPGARSMRSLYSTLPLLSQCTAETEKGKEQRPAPTTEIHPTRLHTTSLHFFSARLNER
jgi:hypothetical protein